ncbi:NYN domain-containing protein [Phytophthora infestans]|nr:NYN domain-containing protein [Phytophthora infestans]
MIGARALGGKIDYIKLRSALEDQASTQFGDCWFFDQNPSAQRVNPALTAEYHMLKFAPPDGPQFQVSLFPMKKYNCHCRRCGNHFTQNVQKGVDNGIATKILSLAYENICDRFILFAGDGDFYSSLSHVRNVLRKDIWVIGYRGTVSGDLQQLASRVLWMNDLWSQVKSIRQGRSQEGGHRDEGRKDRGRKNEMRKDEVVWFEDHEGEDVHFSNDSVSALNEAQEVGSGRQVVIAPTSEDARSRSNQLARVRPRGREGRLNGRGRGRNGRGRSRSRSRDRPRAKPPSTENGATSNALPDVENALPSVPAVASVPVKVTSVPAGVAKRKKKPTAQGKRGAGERNGKKRKRNGADNSEQRPTKRGARTNSSKPADDAPVFTLSDISSDEDVGGKPFPLSLPVPLRSVAPVMAAQDREDGMDEMGSRAEVIDLASETESE